MTRTLSFDFSEFNRRLNTQSLNRATEQAMQRVKQDCLANVNDGQVPVDTGNLRNSINGTSSTNEVVLRANADDGYGFNYAIYVHDVRGNDFFDRSLDEAKAKQILEDELRRALGG